MLYVYKSMLNKYRNDLVFLLLMGMIASLFVSRVFLSVTMILFMVHSFLHGQVMQQFRSFFKQPLLWGMSGLFLIPLLSGCWSDDKQQWMDMLRIKLPLVLLPLAFAGEFSLPAVKWKWLAYFFIFLVLAGSLWAAYMYAVDAASVNEAYLRAKTMVTPLENDHVRFSFLVSIAVLLSAFLFSKTGRRGERVILSLTALWFMVFLHLLAARTGLGSLYIIMISLAGWLLFKKKKWINALALVITITGLGILAYKFMPSLQNRARFFLYEKGYFEKAHYLPGGTDAVRVISLKAGWDLMNRFPIAGTGFGDLRNEAIQWYEENYPGMNEADKIYPSSEWLIYGAGAGWTGFILFTGIILIPFLINTQNRFWFCLLNMVTALSLLFDIGLEVQYGVFIYSFIILWWWKWFKAEIS